MERVKKVSSPDQALSTICTRPCWLSLKARRASSPLHSRLHCTDYEFCKVDEGGIELDLDTTNDVLEKMLKGQFSIGEEEALQ